MLQEIMGRVIIQEFSDTDLVDLGKIEEKTEDKVLRTLIFNLRVCIDEYLFCGGEFLEVQYSCLKLNNYLEIEKQKLDKPDLIML